MGKQRQLPTITSGQFDIYFKKRIFKRLPNGRNPKINFTNNGK
jgi:hypothetical protein